MSESLSWPPSGESPSSWWPRLTSRVAVFSQLPKREKNKGTCVARIVGCNLRGLRVVG
jgi:hypothetical protein